MNEFTKQQNDIVQNFSTTLESRLKAAATKSKTRFKFKAKPKKDGKTDRIIKIGVSMAQYAIFKEKGVGRGRGINSGKTDPDPLYNPIMEQEIPKLANELELNTADLLTKALIR